eukprot:gb/GECG01010577.1/.p1 GENE.gb/GECG01010577.1/~~gb/GECG01010577.1/.p1  ORF type:complete len:292 (+),score=22.98 gb/GECG01010577.1/:1-876(+)
MIMTALRSTAAHNRRDHMSSPQYDWTVNEVCQLYKALEEREGRSRVCQVIQQLLQDVFDWIYDSHVAYNSTSGSSMTYVEAVSLLIHENERRERSDSGMMPDESCNGDSEVWAQSLWYSDFKVEHTTAWGSNTMTSSESVWMKLQPHPQPKLVWIHSIEEFLCTNLSASRLTEPCPTYISVVLRVVAALLLYMERSERLDTLSRLLAQVLGVPETGVGEITTLREISSSADDLSEVDDLIEDTVLGLDAQSLGALTLTLVRSLLRVERSRVRLLGLRHTTGIIGRNRKQQI